MQLLPSRALPALIILAALHTSVAADSGIVCLNDCEVKGLTATVAQGQPTLHTFGITLENTNDVCNEDTRVSAPVFVNDPVVDGTSITKRGSAQLVGLYRGSGSPASKVEWNFEDESKATVYIDVLTGEDTNGCDFQGFDMKVVVCDFGGGCDYVPDGPCEKATAFTTDVSLRAPEAVEVPGTATVIGTVTKTVGPAQIGAAATLTFIKTNGCLVGEPDDPTQFVDKNIDTDKPWQDTAGQYTASALPAGQYKVLARVDAEVQTVNLTISAGSTQTLDFAF